MWGQKFTNVCLVLGITHLSHALPGFQPHGCPEKLNGVYEDSCGSIVSTTSDIFTTTATIDIPSTITSAPSVIVQAYRRDTEDVTAICNNAECSVFDVSSTLLTVFPVPDATNRPRPPFANGTDLSQPHPGPTASGTGVVSGTGILGTSSSEVNGTTIITSRVTMSTIVVTGKNWSDWTTAAMGTGVTGRQPHNSANATNAHHSITASHWSAWSISTGSPQRPSSIEDNSTYISAGQTFTRTSVNSTTSASVSYVTTNTYIFSGSTVVIPIPADFSSTTSSHSTKTKTHTPKHTSSSLVGGRISTSSCWTTTSESTSGTETATITATSKICWILSCDDEDTCTDHISRYPVTVDALSTSAKSSHSYSIVVVTPTMSLNSSAAPTMWSGPSQDMTWTTWSTGYNATNHPSSRSRSRSKSSTRTGSTTRLRSVDATAVSSSSSTTSEFESTYPSWMEWTSTTAIDTATDTETATEPMGPQVTPSNDPIAHPSMSVDGTITRTVVPLPATMTSESMLHGRGAMMNRKRYLREQKHRVGHGTKRQ